MQFAIILAYRASSDWDEVLRQRKRLQKDLQVRNTQWLELNHQMHAANLAVHSQIGDGWANAGRNVFVSLQSMAVLSKILWVQRQKYCVLDKVLRWAWVCPLLLFPDQISQKKLPNKIIFSHMNKRTKYVQFSTIKVPPSLHFDIQ